MNWDEVEAVLRHGEQRRQPDGTYLRVRVSLRELGQRFGVSHTLVARFAKDKGISLTAPRAEAQPSPARRRKAQRAPGRPPTGEEPIVPWDEVEKKLLHGVLVRFANGREAYVIPSADDLAEDVGVDPSLIRRFVRTRRIRERRAELMAEVPVRHTGDEVGQILSGDIQAGPYHERVPRIVDLYAAQFEEDLRAGNVRRGEASVLERLIKADLEIKRAAQPDADVSNAALARMIAERLPAMEAARLRRLAHPETSGEVIDVPFVVVAPSAVPGPTASQPGPASEELVEPP